MLQQKNRRQVLKQKAGAYMVDWDNANVIDLQPAKPYSIHIG